MLIALLSLWALYGLISVAFGLGFRVGGFFDLSVGASFLLGAYTTWLVSKGTPLLFAAGIGILIAALGASAIGMWFIAPLAVRLTPLALFVATLAILYISQAIAALIFGESALVLHPELTHVIDLGSVHITNMQLGFGLLSAAALVGVILWLRLSPWGRFSRAVADDRDLSVLFGVPVRGVILRCYILSGALAGLGGAFFVADRAIDPSQALTILLAGMVAAIVSGNYIHAALLGSLLLAGLETGLGFLLPGNWRMTVAFSVMLIFLIIKRGGLTQIVRRRI